MVVRTWGQLSLASNITESIDTGDGGVLVLVHNDVTTGVQLYTGNIQLQVLDLRSTTNGPENLVNFQLGAVVINQLDQLVLALAITDELDLLEALVLTVELDTSSLVPLGHGLLDHGVELAQEVLTTDEHVGLDVGSVHDTSQLDSNVASANNGNLRGQLLNLEEAITGDTVLGTGHGGDVRTTTGRNQDVRCGVACRGAIGEADLNDLGLDETSAAVNEINAFPVPVALVDAIEVVDHGIAGFLEVLVVNLGALGDIVAVVLGGFQGLVHSRKVPGHLLRDTAGHLG
jgi:hypothetical protein